MGQVRDNNGNIVPNTFTPLGSPIIVATGTSTSGTFLRPTLVELNARTAECFYVVAAGSPTATTNDNPLPSGGSRQIMVPPGFRVASTGGELRITVLGSIDEVRGTYYA